jgi:hypothetical protein
LSIAEPEHLRQPVELDLVTPLEREQCQQPPNLLGPEAGDGHGVLPNLECAEQFYGKRWQPLDGQDLPPRQFAPISESARRFPKPAAK